MFDLRHKKALALKTPILFLIFNRPDTTQRVFEQIALQKPLKLYIAADGARESKTGEFDLCETTRKIVETITWPCEVKKLFREENLGCKIAISSAINWFFEQEEEGIILEDDCLPHPDFFNFCEAMLDRYRTNDKVMHISGNNFQEGLRHGESSYYFSSYAHIWGWATWKSAWKKYSLLLNPEEANALIDKRFKHFLERKYWRMVVAKLQSGEFNTWDYQWTMALWKYEGLAIIPNINLISNIGFGEASTHLQDKNHRFSNMEAQPLGKLIFNDNFIVNEKADHIMTKKMFVPPLYKIVWLKLKDKFIN